MSFHKIRLTTVWFLSILLLLTTQRMANADPYIFEHFTGATFAYGINNNDVIVGQTSINNHDRAFSYDFLNDIFVNLAPNGVTISWAHAINDSGEIAGGGVSDRYRAYYWSNGNYLDLTPTDSYGSNAIDLNEKGNIVGYSNVSIRERRAILWNRNGDHQYLNSLNYTNTIARGINNRGQIVGTGDDGFMDKGLIWNDSFSNPIEISSPENWYRQTIPLAINDYGSVVGYGRGNFWGHAFLYVDEQFIDLHNSSLWENSFAYDINESSQVLIQAIAYDGSKHILIWQDGIFEDITPENYNFFQLSEINDWGHIAGSGYFETTNHFAFIARPATPVPEPGTIILLGTGLLGLVGLGKKKMLWRPIYKKK